MFDWLSSLGGLLNPQPAGAVPVAPAAIPQPPGWMNPDTLNPITSKIPEAMGAQMIKWGAGPEQLMGTFGNLGTTGFDKTPPLGASLAGDISTGPSPDFPPAGPAGADPMAAKAAQNPFKGLSMPTAPQPQRVSTPALRAPGAAIKGGELLALLQMMGAGAGAGGPKIPGLRTAIGG